MEEEDCVDLIHFRQFELKFGCTICWNAKLRMVYGSCQHRFCEDCIYDSNGNRKSGFERCPTCQRINSLPQFRPDVPEDNIEIQVHLGVRKCPNSGCGLEMWHWELPSHKASCRFGATKKSNRSRSNTEISKSTESPDSKKERKKSKKRKRRRREKSCEEYLLRSGKKRKVICE